MIGGLNMRGSLLAAALVAGSLATATSASAADLGGDCCADLEERIAELEATTARKGNRKVSLTISGWVTTQIMGWDDSINSDAYVGTSLNDLGNRLHFDGSAKINGEWDAGFSLRLDIIDANGFQQTADNDDAGAGAPGLLNAYWWLKSSRLGRISVGQQSQASDDVWVDLSGAGSIFAANLVIFDGASFALVPEGTSNRSGAAWTGVGHCYSVGAGIFGDCFGGRTNSVRYDTPTWNGFVLSTSWGEDDFWDVALRHSGEFGDIKTAFGAAFTSSTDYPAGFAYSESDLWQVNFAMLHTPTGLFGSVHYGQENTNGTQPDTTQLYLKGGVRAKLNPLGSTVFYGEYGRDSDMFGGIASACGAFDGTGANIDANCANAADASVAITGSEFNRWGLGVVQEIDAASMAVWLKYKNYDAEVDFTAAGGVTGTEEFEDLHIFAFGGAVFF